MEHSLGALISEPYREGKSGVSSKLATVATFVGTGLLAIGGKRRSRSIAGSALLLSGSLLRRWAVYEAGYCSARDPKYTVIPQRQRLEQR
jgi:hypothetical protein